MDEVKLTSVNWEHGMLLTPDHFLRQEQYVDSLVLWLLRYSSVAYGLVGGGPRLAESERGAVRHDPIVALDEAPDSIGISVTQARGITPGGRIIEIQPDCPVSIRFSKADLTGVAESNVYIVCDSIPKEVVDGQPDEFNPQMRTERRPAYRIALQLEAREAANSISIARIRRPQYGTGYEKDPAYIPPCTTMVSYSELMASWRKMVESVTTLADRYSDLYRAMREFLVLFEERGIETQVDTDAAAFVERMVVALQSTIYEVLDPVQPPARFFGYLKRFFHNAAVYLELTPGVQQYYDTLKETGETEFISLIEQQKMALHASRSLQVNENLAVEVRAAMQALYTLAHLERALEGKYIDFRVSTVLEGMNFIFDRGGKVLYKLAAKPSRVQGFGDELAIHFSNLRLEGRDKYRLILVGEQNANFEKGSRINAEVRLNEGSGFRRAAINLVAECKLSEQHNFECDFEAPDVPTINDARVTLQAHHPIRTALLYTRHRFYGSAAQAAASSARPGVPGDPLSQQSRLSPGADLHSPRGEQERPLRRDQEGFEPNRRPDPAPARGADRLDSDPRDTPRPGYGPADNRAAPWDKGVREEQPRDSGRGDPPPPPPRRRRLE
ncbi:MAG TPA: type VI secretion system baseplate subunit TssK [Candidatus Angelobacter sp.]|jgi:hypothetical protein|nr:type VI secretion system baseplate subunit TssK [Candidatus Angelobacter sp.]